MTAWHRLWHGVRGLVRSLGITVGIVEPPPLSPPSPAQLAACPELAAALRAARTEGRERALTTVARLGAPFAQAADARLRVCLFAEPDRSLAVVARAVRARDEGTA